MLLLTLFFLNCFSMDALLASPLGDSLPAAGDKPGVLTHPQIPKVNISLEYGAALTPFDPDSSAAADKLTRVAGEKAGYNAEIIRALFLKGEAAYDTGNFKQSFAYFRQVLLFCTESDREWKFKAYGRIANIATIQGAYREAADNYYKALALLQNGLDVQKADFYANLSVVWNQLGDTQKSTAYLDRAEKLAVLESNFLALCNILNKKGNAFLAAGDLQKAAVYYTKALKKSRQYGDRSTEAMATGNIGYLHILQNDPTAAKPLIQRFYTLGQHPEVNIFHRLSMLYTYGVYCFLLKDYEAAEKVWIQAEETAEKLNASLYRLKPLFGLSALYAETHNYERASYFQHLYSALKDSVVSAEKLRDINHLEFKYQLAQKEKDLALQQLKITEQKQGAFRQNITMAIFGISIVLLILFYRLIKRNNKRKLLLSLEQTGAFQKSLELDLVRERMAGEEEERKRVALELHDGVGSMLSMAKLNLSFARDQRGDAQADREAFNEVMELLDQSSSVLRTTAHILMPEMFLHSGIENGLQVFFRKLEQSNPLNISYQSYGAVAPLDNDREKELFTIFRELMNTLIKQCQPKNILFQLNWQERLLYVTIEADGIPVDTQNKESPESADWALMQRKVKALKGMMSVDNNKGKGTICDLEFEL